jgi:hypothetical protein
VWSLEQAIRTNPGGVGHPVQVMTLEKATGGDWMVRELIETDFSEHLQAIADAEAVLAKYRDFLKLRRPTRHHRVRLTMPKASRAKFR